MISAVTNQGKVRFLVFDDTMIADILIDICKRLIGVFIVESAMVVLEGNLPRVVNTLS